MLPIFDFKVNGTDDIMILHDDFALEADISTSAFRCGERRCSARYDDFIFTPEISAGIETLIQQYINDYTISEVERRIKSVLLLQNLFGTKDFNIFIRQDNNDPHKLKVLISFNSQNFANTETSYTFSVVVNTENQRAFR